MPLTREQTFNLGAYIGISSGGGYRGFNPAFVGWADQEETIANFLREGEYTRAMLWRPWGEESQGDMPLDAFLNVRNTDNDFARLIGDEGALARALQTWANVLKENAAALGADETDLVMYVGNIVQCAPDGDPGDVKLADVPLGVFWRRAANCLRRWAKCGVTTLALDNSGPYGLGTRQEFIQRLAFRLGYRRFGYEGWAEAGVSDHWCDDGRHTGYMLRNFWALRNHPVFTPHSRAFDAGGRLAVLLTYGDTEGETLDFIEDVLSNGYECWPDMYGAASFATPKHLREMIG